MDSNTLDLPATRPEAPLSPYQQGYPMGAPLDDDVSSGSFSVKGLLHSVRRQLLPALLTGLCLSTLLAGLLWFAIPVTYMAESYLQVNRELFQGTSTDFMIYKETQGSLLKSTFVVNRALQDNEIQQLPIVKYDNFGRPRKQLSTWLSGAINVLVDEDELLYVTMKGRKKEQTEKVLGAVIDSYQSEIINKERLQKVEELSRLRRRYNLVFDEISKESEEIKQLSERVGGLESETIRREQAMKLDELRQAQVEAERISRTLMEAQTKFRMLQTEATLLGSNSPSEYLIQDEMERDPIYYETGLKIQEMKDFLQLNADQIPADSPDMAQLQQQIGFLEEKRKRRASELRPRVIERLKTKSGMSADDLRRDLAIQKTLITNLKDQLGVAKTIYEQRKEEMARFGGSSGDLVARLKALEALQKDLISVQEAKTELEMEIDGRKRVRIIQKPFVAKPSTLVSKVIQIAGGWAISFMGVVAAIAYWDYLGQKVNGAEDMGKFNRVIGSLPGIQGFKGDIKEPMRISADGIRTGILYNRQVPAQCVMVTSATGQEGRSTVASQLAISMARAGKTTLLVDGDLRNPQQHTAFQVQPHGGIGEMLRGEQTSDQAIVATSVENLWLLGAGRCDQNAVRGLSGDQAKAIFEDFRARFDTIIIDASPVLTSPEALLLGQNADAAVISVRKDISQVPKVNAACEQLTSVGIPILGTVLNGGRVETRTGAKLAAIEEQDEQQPALANA